MSEQNILYSVRMFNNNYLNIVTYRQRRLPKWRTQRGRNETYWCYMYVMLFVR